jgi:hypothetical protein
MKGRFRRMHLAPARSLGLPNEGLLQSSQRRSTSGAFRHDLLDLAGFHEQLRQEMTPANQSFLELETVCAMDFNVKLRQGLFQKL